MAKLKNENDVEEIGIDLSGFLDNSFPLLQRLREECPGTFKHSQYLSSITDSVCTALGMDPIKLRVGAMFHDYGKIMNPKIFSENQIATDVDPHETLDPFISAQLITRHVSDSVALLINIPEFPREIIEIISQHHGNSVVKYFFAKSESEDESKYRYNLSRPMSFESGILMICDIVESKSRAKAQSGDLDIEEVIDSTFTDLRKDHQLDDVYLRFGNLGIIENTLAKELEGIFQKRVDYEKTKK